MSDLTAWRCPVCEGVNHGGRVCATCGEALPPGVTPRAATAEPTVVPTVTRVGPAPGRTRTPSAEEIFGSNPFR